MNHYDIVFVGQMGTGTVVPFKGSPFVVLGSPVLFAAIAASSLGKRIAAVTKVSESEEYLLKPMKAAGIDLYVRPGEVGEIRIVFPTVDVDERESFVVKDVASLTIDDIPSFEPCLVHLCCFGVRKSQLDLMQALKTLGFRL